MGEVIAVRWLLNEMRREGKTASSVVVYLQNLGPEACMKMVIPLVNPRVLLSYGRSGRVLVVLSEVYLRFCVVLCCHPGGLRMYKVVVHRGLVLGLIRVLPITLP